MLENSNVIIVIAVAAVCTFATRVLPFVVFGGKKDVPKFIKYLGDVLPVAIIGVLIIYCFGDIRVQTFNEYGPKIIAIIVTAILHYFKGNILLSISVGTIGYMLLINFVF